MLPNGFPRPTRRMASSRTVYGRGRPTQSFSGSARNSFANAAPSPRTNTKIHPRKPPLNTNPNATITKTGANRGFPLRNRATGSSHGGAASRLIHRNNASSHALKPSIRPNRADHPPSGRGEFRVT